MDLAQIYEDEKAEARKKEFRAASSVKQIKPIETAVWGKSDPSKYLSDYGQGKELKKGQGLDGLAGAFMNGNATHGNALLSRRPIKILPGLDSFQESTLLFLRDTANDLNERFPSDLDSDGFSKTGIHMGFDSLKCPAGYFQTPMSYTTVDNTLYREELELPLTYTPRQKAIATEFWNLVFREALVAPVNVAKLSTGGMRRFTSSTQWKLDYANFLTQPVEFERMLQAVDEDDVETLANRYETLYATYIQKRGQVDVAGKKRTVFDLEYAESGGVSGKAFDTDKKVFLHNKMWDDFSAIRARVVHAGPWTVNCFLQMIATPAMQAMFVNWPKTFHINTAEDIKSVIDGHHIFCSDVTEYDRSMSRDAISVVHDVMKEYWDPRMVKASWRLFTSPYYAKPLGLESGKGVWVKNPMDWKDELFAGNRSGHALTSLVAKGNKVIESLFIVDMMYPVLGRVDSFLKHEGPIKLVNNGDDEIVVIKSGSDMARFKELRKVKSNGHYVVLPEDGQGYSGMLMLKPGPELEYFPTARVHTALTKMFIPERSVGEGHREFWPIGMMVRIDNLTSTDIGREIWAVTLHHYKRHIEPMHGDIRGIIAKGAEQMSLALGQFSAADKELLDDRSKIHYKWLPHEISPKVLDLVTSKVPKQRTETILRRYYRGHLI